MVLTNNLNPPADNINYHQPRHHHTTSSHRNHHHHQQQYQELLAQQQQAEQQQRVLLQMATSQQPQQLYAGGMNGHSEDMIVGSVETGSAVVTNTSSGASGLMNGSYDHRTFRDPASAPLRKLSIDLIKTYKRINEVGHPSLSLAVSVCTS